MQSGYSFQAKVRGSCIFLQLPFLGYLVNLQALLLMCGKPSSMELECVQQAKEEGCSPLMLFHVMLTTVPFFLVGIIVLSLCTLERKAHQ